MKKYFTALNIVFAAEFVVVVLASLGLIPREAILGVTGLMIFYMIFSPISDALALTIMSIPLYAAMTLSGSSDSIANWRVLVGVLFLCLFFKQGISVSIKKGTDGKYHLHEKFRHYLAEYLIIPFLLIGALSILAAQYKILTIKELLFLINVFLLFLVVRNVARSRESIIVILRSAAIGASIVVLGWLAQFFVTLFVPLYEFWQFWASKGIAAFYGSSLAQLLSYSNTWFSYFDGRPPILRVFSVFPDSHSLAMFSILAVPIFMALAVFYSGQKNKKILFWVLAILSLAGAVLSGSRGVWLSFIPVAAIALYLWISPHAQDPVKNNLLQNDIFHQDIHVQQQNSYMGVGVRGAEKVFTKKAVVSLSFFIILFLASSFYAPFYYKMQSLSGNFDLATLNFLDRAKSISDFSEISNKARLEIWLASARSIVAHPVLGVGLGNYFLVLNEEASAAKQGSSAHNLYLDIASEMGIIGALLLIVIFLEILRSSWIIYKEAEEPYFKFFGLAFSLYFLWAVIYSLFDVVLLNDKVFLFLMAGLGVLYSIKGLMAKKL